MTQKNIPLLVLLILALLALTTWLFIYFWPTPINESELDGNPGQTGPVVSVEAEFSSKIVYTTNTATNTASFIQDCDQRGGTFNDCGSICAPDAEMCAEVCAYTCEFDKNREENSRSGYDGGLIDINFTYPARFQLEERPDFDLVKLTFIGPTQQEGTEVYDGIIINFRLEDIPENADLETAAKQAAQANPEVTEIINPVSQSQLAGYEAYTYRSRSLGEYTHYILNYSGDQFLHISYTAPDPENQGYQQIVNEILDSLSMDN